MNQKPFSSPTKKAPIQPRNQAGYFEGEEKLSESITQVAPSENQVNQTNDLWTNFLTGNQAEKGLDEAIKSWEVSQPITQTQAHFEASQPPTFEAPNNFVNFNQGEALFFNQPQVKSEQVVNFEFTQTATKSELKIEEVLSNPEIQLSEQIVIEALPQTDFKAETANLEPKPPKLERNPSLNILKSGDLGIVFGETKVLAKKGVALGKDVNFALKDLFINYIFIGMGKPKEQKTPEQKEKEAIQKTNKKGFFDSLKGFSNFFLSIDRKTALNRQREDINKKVGPTNLSFEEILSNSGQVRVDIQTELDRKNSELEANQVKQKREKQLSFINGKKKSGKGGPSVNFKLNTASELGSQNVTKLIG